MPESSLDAGGGGGGGGGGDGSNGGDESGGDTRRDPWMGPTPTATRGGDRRNLRESPDVGAAPDPEPEPTPEPTPPPAQEPTPEPTPGPDPGRFGGQADPGATGSTIRDERRAAETASPNPGRFGGRPADEPDSSVRDIDLGAARGRVNNDQSPGGGGVGLTTAGTRTDLGPGNMPDTRGRLSPAADFVGGITTDAAASTASGIERVQETPLGDFGAGFARGVRDATDTVQQTVVDPAAGFAGRAIEVQAQLEQARDPRVPPDDTSVGDVVGGGQTDNLANPQTQAGRVGERAAGGFGDAAVSIPEDVVSAGAAGAEVTEAGAETIAAEGPVEGTQEIGDAARAGVVAAAGGAASSARESPARFTGGVAGGIFGGTAFVRAAESATKAGRIQRRTDRQSDPVDFEEITSDRGVEGNRPKFDTPTDAPTEQAVQEVTERATDNPDAVTDRLDTDMVTFRSESERLPDDFEAQPGQYELPGLFTSADASPLRADVTDSGGGLRLPFTKGATRPETFSAFELEDVRAIPDRAAGSGASTPTDVDLDTPGGRFLTQEAERGPAFVRPAGDRNPELESVFPPGTAFERIGGARLRNVGGGTLDLFRRADARDTTDIDFDKPPAARGDGDTSIYSADEIRSRERASRTEGEPVSPTPATPTSRGNGSGGGSPGGGSGVSSGGGSSGGGPLPRSGSPGGGSGGGSSGGGPLPPSGSPGGGSGGGGSGGGPGGGSSGGGSGDGSPGGGSGVSSGGGSSGGGPLPPSGSPGSGSGGGSPGGGPGGGSSSGGYGGGTPSAPGNPGRPLLPDVDLDEDERREERARGGERVRYRFIFRSPLALPSSE